MADREEAQNNDVQAGANEVEEELDRMIGERNRLAARVREAREDAQRLVRRQLGYEEGLEMAVRVDDLAEAQAEANQAAADFNRAMQRRDRMLAMVRELDEERRLLLEMNERARQIGEGGPPEDAQALANEVAEELDRAGLRRRRIAEIMRELEREVGEIRVDMEERARQRVREGQERPLAAIAEIEHNLVGVQPQANEAAADLNLVVPRRNRVREMLRDEVREHRRLREAVEQARQERDRLMIVARGLHGRQPEMADAPRHEVVVRRDGPELFRDAQRLFERIRDEELERRRQLREERERLRRADDQADEQQRPLEGPARPRLRRLMLQRQLEEPLEEGREWRGWEDLLRGEERGQDDRVATVSEEMMREAQRMREEDESRQSSTRYSRACVVCAIDNPQQRAVFTQCGHIVCYPCAVQNARSDATDGRCVFCRKRSEFVKLFEEECGSEEKNEVNEENRSMMGRAVDCGKIAGDRIYSLLSHPLSWTVARDVTCIGLAVALYRKAPPNARIFVGGQLIALANLSLALRLKHN